MRTAGRRWWRGRGGRHSRFRTGGLAKLALAAARTALGSGLNETQGDSHVFTDSTSEVAAAAGAWKAATITRKAARRQSVNADPQAVGAIEDCFRGQIGEENPCGARHMKRTGPRNNFQQFATSQYTCIVQNSCHPSDFLVGNCRKLFLS